jgi:two-component system, OmpR family, response regulator
MQINRILMVDDDPTIRMIGEISLSQMGGWDVALAPSGQQALELVKGFRPDVILLDVMMPLMDGPTTLRMLQDDPDNLPSAVIFLTGVEETQEIQKLMQLGATGVIPKPFDPVKLPGEIRKVCSTRAYVA